jgi:hypothetical protein
MALANAVQGATHTPQRITWSDTDGDPVNLTGAVLSGRVLRIRDGSTVDIAGEMDIVSALNGVFDWTYGAADVAEAGEYIVQFTATFGVATRDRTLKEAWTVVAAL